LYTDGDGTLKIYTALATSSSTYGKETVCLQTAIDGNDPETYGGTLGVSNSARCVLALQPRGGNVGIGTTSPAYKLHVNGSAYATSLNIDGGIDITRYNPSSGVYVMRFYTLSNASIDVNTGSGTASINKAWSVGSDMRLKNVWRHFDIDVNSVAKAPLFTYRLKSGGSQLMVGTSAQYWMEKIPETVTTGYDGYYSLDYNGVLTASVISVARKVVDHELRIKQLEQENMELREEIKQLKAA
jgi:hypothetical protein